MLQKPRRECATYIYAIRNLQIRRGGDEFDLFEHNDFEAELVETGNIDSFTELFPFLRSRSRAPLPLLAGSAALRWGRAEVVDAERGDLVPDAADRRELLSGGLSILFGERQSVEVLLFEAGPLPRGIDLQTVNPLSWYTHGLN